MKSITLIGLITLLTVGFVGCASTNVKEYDDGGRIYLGTGGAKETKNGVDIWSEGAPPRYYRVLAMINDERNNAVIPMARFKGDVVKAVRKQGGDAAIIITQGISQMGSYSVPGVSTTNYNATVQQTYAGSGQYNVQGRATTTSTPTYNVAVNRKYTTFVVIKYVSAEDAK
ncbi:hypothetical protein M2103_001263 [Ereboglobus sp. PH5-5]|uniref:hypothetical protein n=1 Tax=Ereboglobus sp. PH5-5 TaxID=2940529 RepID=UPI002405F34D|nr:hypothetical protein [Ereboglobus sp. PH5-5]MDF9833046.1 hypothetical protein [Ereboglobus sp. PH5-5]